MDCDGDCGDITFAEADTQRQDAAGVPSDVKTYLDG